MLNDVSFRLMHRHGDDYVADGRARRPPITTPRTGWLRGARIFRCTTCEEEVVLVPPTEEPGDQAILRSRRAPSSPARGRSSERAR